MIDKVRNSLAFVVRYLPMRGKWRFVNLIAGLGDGLNCVVVRIPRVDLMELDLNSSLDREIFVTGKHGDEDVVRDTILDHLNERGAIFVDIGANVGYYTIAAVRHLAGLWSRHVFRTHQGKP